MALGSMALGSQIIHSCGEGVYLNVMLTRLTSEGHMLNAGIIPQREQCLSAVWAVMPTPLLFVITFSPSWLLLKTFLPYSQKRTALCEPPLTSSDYVSIKFPFPS